MSNTVTFRTPTLADVPALANLHHYIWHDFYKDILPPTYAPTEYPIDVSFQENVQIIENISQYP